MPSRLSLSPDNSRSIPSAPVPCALVRRWLAALLVLLFLSPSGVAIANEDGKPLPAAVRAVMEAEQARVRVVEKVAPTVVAIYGNQRGGGGSGVLIDPDGYAVTNYHVVAAAGTSGWAGLADGELYRWNLVGIDPGGDVAIIKLDGREPFPYAEFGDSDDVRVGDWALAMGNPFSLTEDLKPTVTMGIISGVNRFQPGTGPTRQMLVYGDCIQFDTSINPGNSGGPLFNMDGRIIGINGRGSFEERGRVNVGLGYAISAEQVKNFIPDLLASRTTMHGTLDAVFAQREPGVVVCQSINLDSPIARAGMRPGDRLVSFEGRRIRSANQFASVITIFPANWPVNVVWERGGERMHAVVRLTPLPFAPTSGGNPGADRRPGNPRSPTAPPTTTPGEIRDTRIADREGARIFDQWVRWRGELNDYAGLEIVTAVIDGDREVGTHRLAVRRAGERFGQVFEDMPDRTVRSLSTLGEPVAEAASIILRSDRRHWRRVRLLGGDRAAGERAFRIHLTDRHDEHWMIWISVMDRSNTRLEPRLIKVSRANEQGEPLGVAMVLGDYRQVEDVRIPFQRRFVRGDDESLLLTFEGRSVRLLGDVAEFEHWSEPRPAPAPAAEPEPEPAEQAEEDDTQAAEEEVESVEQE
ncbi:MAG: trypsin-like peptidase domain-containing protein [Phycisphaeraceae bacterium]|nr:trypsin-like peptidase domain-containing protein [Phycisphaeraceae bacterium]